MRLVATATARSGRFWQSWRRNGIFQCSIDGIEVVPRSTNWNIVRQQNFRSHALWDQLRDRFLNRFHSRQGCVRRCTSQHEDSSSVRWGLRDDPSHLQRASLCQRMLFDVEQVIAERILHPPSTVGHCQQWLSNKIPIRVAKGFWPAVHPMEVQVNACPKIVPTSFGYASTSDNGSKRKRQDSSSHASLSKRQNA